MLSRMRASWSASGEAGESSDGLRPPKCGSSPIGGVAFPEDFSCSFVGAALVSPKTQMLFCVRLRRNPAALLHPAVVTLMSEKLASFTKRLQKQAFSCVFGPKSPVFEIVTFGVFGQYRSGGVAQCAYGGSSLTLPCGRFRLTTGFPRFLHRFGAV